MEEVKSIHQRVLLKWFISIIVPLFVLLMPTNDIFTAPIRLFTTITTFYILLIAFELLEYMLIAVALPFTYVLFGLAPISVAMGGWGNIVPWVVLGAFLMSNVLNEVGLLKRIAYWCILRTGCNFTGILWGIMFGTLILTVLTSVNSCYILPPLLYAICRALNIEKSKEAAAIMCTGAIAANTSGLFLYQPSMLGLLQAGAQSVDPTFRITWVGVIWHNLPQLLFVVLMVFVISKLYQPKKEINGHDYFQKEYEKLGKLSMGEKRASVITVVIFAYLILSGFVGLDVSWGFILLPWLFCLPIIGVATPETIKNLNFKMIFFMVACLSIGMVSASLGVGQVLSQIMVPILSSLSPTMVLAFIWLFGAAANFLLTPMAILAAFTGPIAQISIDLGINLHASMYALYFSTDQLLFAYESVPYLVFFVFGLIPVKDFMKIMGFKMILAFIFMMAICLPWWRFIGIFS